MIKIFASDVARTLTHERDDTRSDFLDTGQDLVFTEEARDILAQIRDPEQRPVVLITGSRISSYHKFAFENYGTDNQKPLIPHTHVVLEHGCKVIDSDTGRENDGWVNRMADQLGAMYRLKRELTSRVPFVDDIDRDYTFRLEADETTTLNTLQERLEETIQDLDVETQIRYFRHRPNIEGNVTLEVIPSNGGKLNAGVYIAEERGLAVVRRKDEVYIPEMGFAGDDTNDLDIMRAVSNPYTLLGAIDDVLNLVGSRTPENRADERYEGHIALQPGHAGTVRILEQVAQDMGVELA